MLENILKFAKSIKTFKQLAILIIGGTLALSAYTLWENRTTLITRASETKLITSETAKNDVTKLFNFILQSPSVSAVILQSVDLSINKREILAWQSKDPEIADQIARIKRENPIQSVFSETDPEVNLIIAQVINNKIACVPYNKFYKFTSTTPDKIKAICVISVPPLNEVSSSIVRKEVLSKLQQWSAKLEDSSSSISR